jgi:serine/threonine-protein kinase
VLSINAAVDYTLQAIEALAEAHTNELVHGNLTPSHLFVTRGPDGLPVVKVLGFGVADSLCSSPLGEDRAVPANESNLGDFPEGTTTMAPEQIRGSMDIDALVDVWGLGGLLHHLLTGQPVFQATTGPALVAMIAADSPAPVTALRTDVPAGLESIILRCLAKDRRERFATVGELAVALEAYASPDLQTSVNRIVRTLVKSTRPPPLPHAMGTIQAMVHVPRPPSNPPAAATPPAVPAGTPVPGSVSGMSLSSLQEYAGDGKGIVIPKAVLVGAVSFVALGLAAVLGGVFASRLASPAAATASNVAAAATVPKAPVAETPAAPAEPPAPATSATASAAPASSAAAPPAAAPPVAAQPAPVAPAPARPARAAPARAPVARVAAPAKTEKAPAPERRASAPAAPAPEKRASAEDLFDDTR